VSGEVHPVSTLVLGKDMFVGGCDDLDDDFDAGSLFKEGVLLFFSAWFIARTKLPGDASK
jgi:hypothetical protein